MTPGRQFAVVLKRAASELAALLPSEEGGSIYISVDWPAGPLPPLRSEFSTAGGVDVAYAELHRKGRKVVDVFIRRPRPKAEPVPAEEAEAPPPGPRPLPAAQERLLLPSAVTQDRGPGGVLLLPQGLPGGKET